MSTLRLLWRRPTHGEVAIVALAPYLGWLCAMTAFDDPFWQIVRLVK